MDDSTRSNGFGQKAGGLNKSSLSSHSAPTTFNHLSEQDLANRKACILAAHEFYLALNNSYHKLQDLDKLLEKQDVIDAQKKDLFYGLLEKVESLLDKANWESSLFFKSVANQMRTFLTQLGEALAKDEGSLPTGDLLNTIPEYMQKVYVLLYLTDGTNLKKWASVLSNIAKTSVGRPVYSEENQIMALIRSKPDARFDGYVGVLVNKKDVIAPVGGIIPKDKLGNSLLTIREGTILAENIKEFVRMTSRPEERYHFIDGELVLIRR